MQQQRKRPRIEETNISGLPNEIWLLILSFVPEWLNLHFVCRDFYAIFDRIYYEPKRRLTPRPANYPPQQPRPTALGSMGNRRSLSHSGLTRILVKGIALNDARRADFVAFWEMGWPQYIDFDFDDI
ncbi:Fbox domain containing protein [Acanthamoeba castellanii str. Neff]|uniref:Fbox domain containing protein n=1 Tax=Acanthamoeba castellanii (strain ATCC 30010 / Neff) TaxID=1257118 RepID=L8GNI3_ACACF|nr:Fbox domain containing protein [Acanthamoeba castellanii str. Neff]ELR13796.1 Fbox domain containing protein [Acanthamoeba castellanii str. Neff]